MGNRVAIVGVGRTPHVSRRPDVNQVEMINEAVRAALDDAQLTIKDIDAVLCGNMDHFEGHYLADAQAVDGSGAYLKPGLKMSTGGTIGTVMVLSAWYHVASGLFDTVLTVAFQKHDESVATSAMTAGWDPIYERGMMTGAIGFLSNYALRYMEETGAREEHAAMVRVMQSEGAAGNPYAHIRMKASIEDVLNSRMVVYPLRLLTICPTSCGAAALILASEEKTKKITNKPVWFRDHITVHRENFTPICDIGPYRYPESTQRIAARKLFNRNGITNPRKEFQVFELYDPTSWAILHWSEDFLIFEKGEAWKAAEKRVMSREGEFPICPSGGVTCTNAIGSSGTMRVLEAALQIRGDAGEHQVTREVKKALVSGYGGSNWTDLIILQKSLLD